MVLRVAVLSVAALISTMILPASVAQDRGAMETSPVERITVYERDNQCYYSLERSESQDHFEIAPEMRVQLVARGVSARVDVLPDRGHPGVRGQRDRFSLVPGNNLQGYNARPAGPGETEHQIRIRCCRSITPAGECQGFRWARAEGDPDGPYPGRPDQEGEGPDVQPSERPQMPPFSMGGPSMKVVDP
jgi:hypothetical protein